MNILNMLIRLSAILSGVAIPVGGLGMLVRHPPADGFDAAFIALTVVLASLYCFAEARGAPRRPNKELVEASKAVILQWDTPNWKLDEPTAAIINRLRNAVAFADLPE